MRKVKHRKFSVGEHSTLPADAASIARRKYLVDSGSLEDCDSEWWKLTRNYEISAPFTAITVVNGSVINGLRGWKDANGVKLGELLEAPNYSKAPRTIPDV